MIKEIKLHTGSHTHPDRIQAQKLLDAGATLIVNCYNDTDNAIFIKVKDKYMGISGLDYKVQKDTYPNDILSNTKFNSYVEMYESGWWEFFKPDRSAYNLVKNVEVRFNKNAVKEPIDALIIK